MAKKKAESAAPKCCGKRCKKSGFCRIMAFEMEINGHKSGFSLSKDYYECVVCGKRIEVDTRQGA